MESGDSRLADTLSLLMKNPELLRGFASLLGGAGTGAISAGDGADQTELEREEAPSSGGDRLSEIIDSVLAGGGAASPSGEPSEQLTGERSFTRSDATLSGENASVAAGAFGSSDKRKIFVSGDKRLALLVALKPYLSPRRAAAVDGMVRFGKIGELLEGLLPGNGGK